VSFARLATYIEAEHPLTIVDVGCRGGFQERWTPLRGVLPLRLIGFEPDPEECNRLNRTALPCEQYVPAVLGEEEGKRPFFVTRSPGNWGFYPPDSSFVRRFVSASDYDILETQMLPLTTLDQIADQYGISDIDLLKSDTEGWDLSIFRGAQRSLPACFGVEVEVWFNAVYKGQPLFAEVDAELRRIGFVLFDVARSNFFKRTVGAHLGGPKGQLVAGDAIYFRDLLKVPAGSSFMMPHKLLRCLVVLMRYGYYDYALELVEAARDSGALANGMAQDLEREIRHDGRRILPAFRGRQRLSSLLRLAAMRLSLRDRDHLGNV